MCADKQSTDWFNSISRTLRWNEREKQKSFVVIEEDAQSTSRRPKKSSQGREQRPEGVAEDDEHAIGLGLMTAQEELKNGTLKEGGSKGDDIGEDEVEDEEEEEKFDIDE